MYLLETVIFTPFYILSHLSLLIAIDRAWDMDGVGEGMLRATYMVGAFLFTTFPLIV